MTVSEFVNKVGFSVKKEDVKKVNDTISSIKSTATKVLGAIGIGFSLKQLNAISEEFTQINTQIEYITKGLEDSKEAQDVILKTAQNCRSAYGTISGYVTKLVQTNSQLFPLEDAAKFVENTTKLGKAAGYNESVIASMNTTLQKVMTTGRMTSAEYSSLAQSAPALIDTISEGLGITKKELKLAAQAGIISAGQIKSAMLNATASIDAAYQNTSLKISDALLMIRNQFGLWVADTDKALGLSKTLAKMLVQGFSSVMNVLNKVRNYVVWLNQKLGGMENTLKLLAIAIGSITAYAKAGQIKKSFDGLLTAFTKVGVKGAIVIGVIALIALALEDIFQFIKGNNSYLEELLTSAGVDIEEVRATLQRLFDDLKSSLGEAWSQIKDALKQLLPAIMNVIDKILPLVLSVVEGIMPVLSAIGDVVSDVLSIAIEFIGQVLDALTPLFDVLRDALSAIFPVLKQLVESVGRIITNICQTVLPKLIPIIEKVVAAASKIIEKILPPILNLIQRLMPLVERIINAILPILATLLDLIGPLLDAILAILDPLLDIVALLIDLIAPIVEMLTPVIEILLELVNTILEPIISIISELVRIIGENLSMAIKNLKAILKPIIEIIKVGLGTAIKNIVEVIKGAINIVKSAIDTIKKVFGGLIDFVAGVFTGDWDRAWNGIKQSFTAVWDHIKNVFSTIWETFKNIGKNIIDGIKEGFSAAWNGLKDAVTSIFDNVVGWFKNLFGIHSPSTVFKDFGTNIMQGLIDGLKGMLSSVVDVVSGIGSKISNAFSAVWDGVKNIAGKIGDAVSGAASAVADWAGNAWEDVKEGASNAVAQVKETVSSVGSAISNAASTAGSWVAETASSVGEWASNAASTVGNVVSSGWGKVKNFFGLAEGGYIGANRPTPVVIGDNKNEGEIVSPISKMRQTVLDALSAFGELGDPRPAAKAISQGSVTNRSITQNITINNKFEGDRAGQQKSSEAMDKAAGDCTAELARGLAFAK